MFHSFNVTQNPYETMRGHFSPSVFDPSLNSFISVSISPWKLTYLYQKLNIIAISRWSKISVTDKEGIEFS
jgi:hypothetical protein